MYEFGDEVMTTSEVRTHTGVQQAFVWCRHRGIRPLPLFTADGERLWFAREIREGRRIEELWHEVGGLPEGYSDALSTEQVRELFGYARRQAARTQCRRHGIEPLPLRSERNERLWPGAEVRALHQRGSEPGVRTDLGFTTSQGRRKRGDALDEQDREVLGYMVAREQRGESDRAYVVATVATPAAGECHPTRMAQLERRGMVKRSWRDSAGRRRRVARLTEHGRAVFAADAQSHGRDES